MPHTALYPTKATYVSTFTYPTHMPHPLCGPTHLENLHKELVAELRVHVLALKVVKGIHPAL